MNKKLLQTLNSALERTKTTHYAPVTIDALQARLTEELDWLDACPGRECLIVLLQELAAKMRSARIVVSPGYSFLPDSYLLFLTGVTKVNPVEWDLPFSRFTKSVHNSAEIPFEAGTVELEAGDEFKIITPDATATDGWKYFGGEDANQVGYFLINNDLLGINITLMDGANFQVADGGSYDITVKATQAKGLQEPLAMVITKTPTAISTVGVDAKSNEWYNLNGQKLSGKPAVPGIYINGGKKVVIK